MRSMLIAVPLILAVTDPHPALGQAIPNKAERSTDNSTVRAEGSSESVTKQALDIGKPAPLITACAWLNGDPLVAYEPGKVYVLHTWAMRHRGAQQAQRFLSKLAKDHAGECLFVGLNVDQSIERVKAVLSKRGPVWDMEYLQAIDRANPESDPSFVVSWLKEYPYIPFTVVIDQRGRVAWMGHSEEVKKPLEQILAGEYDIEAAAEKQKQERMAATRVAEQQEGAHVEEGQDAGVPQEVLREYLAAQAEYEAEAKRVDAQLAYYNQFSSQFPIDNRPGVSPAIPEIDRSVLYRFERARQAYNAALQAAGRR